MRTAMPGVDLVIEVLDARIPFSSENPLVAELRGTKPCIQILNTVGCSPAKVWLVGVREGGEAEGPETNPFGPCACG